MCVRECYEGDNERESELRVVVWGSICEIIKSMVHEEIICGREGWEKRERKRDRARVREKDGRENAIWDMEELVKEGKTGN